MRFSTLIAFLPATLAVPYPYTLAGRAADLAPQVLEQIADLGTATTELTTAVNNFDGSLLGLLPQSLAVITAETKLDATILKTTAIVKQSSNFTLDESNSIVGALGNLVAPIQGSLTALTAKYPVFKQTLESPIVLLDLKVLKAHTDNLITALTTKVNETTVGFLGLGQGIIDQAFDDAIAVYSGQ